jgi:hypothetical protein
MRAKTGHEMAGRTKDAGPGSNRQPLANRKLFFLRAIWSARVGATVASLVIAFLLGAFFVNYGSKLYEDWRQNRLLHEASALLGGKTQRNIADGARGPGTTSGFSTGPLYFGGGSGETES